MKYQKTVKCKLFVTKSGMWVEIGQKNSKSEILFLLQIFTDSLVLWICYCWSVDLCNNYHFLVSIFLFFL